jgi:hypothetical protein
MNKRDRIRIKYIVKEQIFEDRMAENFPKLVKWMIPQILWTHHALNSMNKKNISGESIEQVRQGP